LFLANISGVIRHVLRRDEGSPNIINTEGRDYCHRSSHDEHQERPSSHTLLGYQVAFGAFVFMSGIYHANNAFRLGGRIKAEAGALYFICGMTLIFLGMGIFFAGFFP
jgi:hypothetical protein